MENEHSGPYFEEREIHLKRMAESEKKEIEEIVVEKKPVDDYTMSRDELLSIIRSSKNHR